MFSFALLSSTFASGASTKRRLNEAGSSRRRVDVSEDFGVDSKYSCTNTAASYTWTKGWSDYAGTIEVEVPDGDMGMGLALVVKLKSGKEGSIAALKDGCGACTKAEASEKDTDALILTLDSWLDNHEKLSMYMNFGEDASDNDIASDLEFYYCFTPPTLYFEPETDLKGTIAGIMGFLAQGSWETNKWQACDENNHTGWDDAPCSQRESKERYHSLTTGFHPCVLDDGEVDPQMSITAVASNGAAPLHCEAGGDLERCCWWGRGAIQVTGPSNVGALQYDVVARKHPTIDLCKNPDMICTNDDLKFVSGLWYWTDSVQRDPCFTDALAKYTESYDSEAKFSSSCRAFARGIGGVVNGANGKWADHAHGEDCAAVLEGCKGNADCEAGVDCEGNPDGRVERFVTLMDTAQTKIADVLANGAGSGFDECTGNDKVDAVFHKMDLGSLTEISGSSSKYTLDGFCHGLKDFIPKQ